MDCSEYLCRRKSAMKTHSKEKWNLCRAAGISQDSGVCRQMGLVESALLQIASVRYQAFRVRFGRDPFPNEPLFFSPEADSPVEANPFQVHAQLADACRETGVTLSMLASFW